MTTFPDITASASAGPSGEPDRAVTSSRVDWAPVPRVNLLPPEIVEGRRLGRLKRVLGAGVLVVVAGCAGAVVWAQGGVSSAQADVDAAQVRAGTLHAQQAKYAQVPRVLGLIDGITTARQTAMSQDVLWYGFLSDLSLTTPKGVSLLNLEVTLDTSPTPSAGDALVPSGIGQVSFSGKADHFPDVAAWLDAVGTVHGLDGSTLQTATRGTPQTGGPSTGGSITFTSTVQVTAQALTHRYDRKAD